jgi:hypothetical protein
MSTFYRTGESRYGRTKRLNVEQRKDRNIRNSLDAGWAEVQVSSALL